MEKMKALKMIKGNIEKNLDEHQLERWVLVTKNMGSLWNDLFDANEILTILERAIAQTILFELVAPLGRNINRELSDKKPCDKGERDDIEKGKLIARFSETIDVFHWNDVIKKIVSEVLNDLKDKVFAKLPVKAGISDNFGYWIDGGETIVCRQCITDEEKGKTLNDDLIFDDGTWQEDNICDRCGKKINGSTLAATEDSIKA